MCVHGQGVWLIVQHADCLQQTTTVAGGDQNAKPASSPGAVANAADNAVQRVQDERQGLVTSLVATMCSCICVAYCLRCELDRPAQS